MVRYIRQIKRLVVIMLQTVNFTDARNNFKNFCDDVVENKTTLIVTRRR